MAQVVDRVESREEEEGGRVVTASRVVLPTLTRADHGKELSCEVVHPGLGLPLWVKAMLNIGCKSGRTLVCQVLTRQNEFPFLPICCFWLPQGVYPGYTFGYLHQLGKYLGW